MNPCLPHSKSLQFNIVVKRLFSNSLFKCAILGLASAYFHTKHLILYIVVDTWLFWGDWWLNEKRSLLIICKTERFPSNESITLKIDNVKRKFSMVVGGF